MEITELANILKCLNKLNFDTELFSFEFTIRNGKPVIYANIEGEVDGEFDNIQDAADHLLSYVTKNLKFVPH